jgi:hypothetical protein
VIDTYLSRLELLISEGRQLQTRFTADPNDRRTSEGMRIWQRECATMVNELSGGTKAHWLAQAFSEAFLVRSASGPVVTSAAPAQIVGRIVGVLTRAATSLSTIDQGSGNAGSAGPPPRRFDFVHDATLRPVLETAYLESKQAFEEGRFNTALATTCGLLEAVITDALAHARAALESDGPSSSRPFAGWSFSERIAAAEEAGLIGGGCARLPVLARQYRDLMDRQGELRADVEVSERDARLAAQVLNVILRDLNPGR